jgi:hypothetical protein
VIDSAGAGVDGCSALCNAVTPSYPIVEANGGQGNVTMYATAASSGGACNYGVTSVRYYVAVNVNVVPGDGQGEWQGGRICGQCVEVTAFTSQGPASVVVRIMDKCPDGDCGMDLGGSAPAAIMLDSFGRYNGSWRFVSCTGHPEVSDGAPSLFVSSGSNAWWSRVQVRNPASAVASIAWQDPAGSAQGSFPYATDPENTFEVPTAVLQSSAASIVITVQYTDGTTTISRTQPKSALNRKNRLSAQLNNSHTATTPVRVLRPPRPAKRGEGWGEGPCRQARQLYSTRTMASIPKKQTAKFAQSCATID